MKSKKKLIISLSVTIAVLFISIITIVSVSAALNQNISSKVKVDFKPSKQVIGSVSATYTYGKVTRNMTTNGMGNGNTKVSFNYNDKSKIQTLQMRKDDLTNGRLDVSSDVSEVIFAFVFKNTGYSNFYAELDLGGVTTNENIKISYSLDKILWLGYMPEIIVRAPVYHDENAKICYIKLEAQDSSVDANFEGLILWNLIAEDDA